MFQSFKKIPITLNNSGLIINEASLSTNIELQPSWKYDSRTTDTELPSSMWKNELKLNYYLTGPDYLKQYIYSNEKEPISGNVGGLLFNQGYLSNYAISIIPNSPIVVNATIQIFDKISGSINPTNQTISTGTILRTSDIIINNLSNYTNIPLNNITKASFDYSCNIVPTINAFDTGVTPTKVDAIFLQERTITTEIVSDNQQLDLPLSGDNFGIIFNFENPYNTGIYESFGCSGKINSKQFNLNTNSPHSHNLKIIQHHLNPTSYIYNIITGISQFTVNFNTGGFPLSSRDGQLNYIDKIFIGDTEVTGYTVNRTSNYDQIIAPIPFNTINDILTIYTSKGNYIYPNKINFSYNPITISGFNPTSGFPSNNITISGSNFVRISDVLFGNTQSNYQLVNPQTIQAIVPLNGNTNQIKVISNSRNLTGISNNTFFYNPTINSIYPNTGQWKDTINITGTNFSGITGVYFNNVPAYTFNVINNNYITCQSPETGMGFANGYLNIYGTGGNTQSYSSYNPVVPIYGFYPTSGIPGTGLTIYTKIDTGYFSPTGGGYKVKVGGQDTIFYISGQNSTGALTGIIPSNVNDDYIYIYQPNGITTSSSSTKLDIIGQPYINYVSPISVNRYSFFNLFIVGNNFKYFNNSPSALSFYGGVSRDYQSYGTGSFNYSNNSLSLLANNLIITGNTGYYDVTITNVVTGYTLKSGLFIYPEINQALSMIASYNKTLVNVPASYCIDNSNYTYAQLFPVGSNTTNNTGYINLYPASNINISKIFVNRQYTGITPIKPGFPLPISGTYYYPPSGILQLFSGSNFIKCYESPPTLLSGNNNIYSITSPITGITRIRLCTLSGYMSTDNKFVQVNEIEIY